MTNGNGKDFIVGVVVGGILGAVTALLFAPKSGRDLRTDISDQCRTASVKTQEVAKKVGDQTAEWLEKAKQVGENVMDEVKILKLKRTTGPDGQVGKLVTDDSKNNDDYLTANYL